MKYLRPLYTGLAHNAATSATAQAVLERNRAGYHPIARQMVETILREAP